MQYFEAVQSGEGGVRYLGSPERGGGVENYIRLRYSPEWGKTKYIEAVHSEEKISDIGAVQSEEEISHI